jgi:PAS domain S-box-containing protein
MSDTPSGIASLRDEFHDAEAICGALRNGEVDAVVVGKNDEDKRVLLLSGAYTRYRQLVEDMIQGAVTLSGSGEILFANHAFADMAGVALLDIFRSPVEKLVAPGDHGKLAGLLKPRAGQHDLDLSLVRPDGTRAHVRASVVSASEDFVTLILTPIALRGRDEAEATVEAIRTGSVDAFVVGGKKVVMLDSAQAHYRALVERMRQGAVTVTPDGMIVYANERFISTIGVPHGRVVGQPLAALIAEGDRAALQAMLSGGESTQGELKLRCANGTRPVMLASMTSLDGHKLFLFTDLTEQKRHEAADERTRRFLGMLAHEFRNILGPISNCTQALRQQGLGEDGGKAVEIIERQTARLLALVEDLRRINPRE